MTRVAAVTEQTPLLEHESDTRHLSKAESSLGENTVGELLPYNDYATIDWLHDLVGEGIRVRNLQAKKGLRNRALLLWDATQSWLAAALCGLLTAAIAFSVDVSEATVSDWKFGYCSSNYLSSRKACCTSKVPAGAATYDLNLGPSCEAWKSWSGSYWSAFAIYSGFALIFGLASVTLTMTTKARLPTPMLSPGEDSLMLSKPAKNGKVIYLAAGSGIPEIKTVLLGFVIPGILSLKVLLVKAIGAVFAVGSGLCLGKEGPFIHISTCVASLVAKRFPKYRDNGRKLREMLSAGCAAGISVAFGAPIGGVLFSYEEISTFFPRGVLWRAFLCSLIAAVALKALNPQGNGKLALFETNYGISYSPSHYMAFAGLGIAGGCFGGAFCKLNFSWSRWFRGFSIIKSYPQLEIALVVLVTSLIHYPNPITREPGDHIIKQLLRDCREKNEAWICVQEASQEWHYIGWLVYGALAKLFLTIITFGCKVPSGVIIPALDAGAFFGRLLGQAVGGISPGIFAMVGAAAFLAGVSRMTISLCVVMFELTGELEYIVPNMIAILIAKWVADTLEPSGVYDLAQTVLGHPFIDGEHAVELSQHSGETAASLIPPAQTMLEITVDVSRAGDVPRSVLEHKLKLLKRRGLIDGGLVLVQNGELKGYIVEHELEQGLHKQTTRDLVRLLGSAQDMNEDGLDLRHFVNRCPITVATTAPMEYVAVLFTSVGLRYLCLVEEGSNRLAGVVIKKRFIAWLEGFTLTSKA